MASENLTKPYLKEALEQAMEEQGITDDLLLKEHKKVIIQSKHLPSKNTAIDMAYKLKGSYAPDKKQVSNLNININDSEQVLKRLRDLKDELKEEAKEAKDGQSTQINKEGGEGETLWEGGESNMDAPTVISHKITKPVSTFFLEKDNDNHLDTSKRLLFIAPRGFAKSTLCSVFFPLWLALYGKKKDIFVVSATISLAKEMLRKIRAELEGNERILSDFGEMKSDKWTEDILILNNGAIIRAKGREFQIRGFRPDMI